eukprot:GHVQ01037633.1.p1 GENE.GHVQ01037633.1~~GHVQ01037633.1.p1  ORF type:complete len:760 (+),score=110.44 GHVQ01037633.1:304-2583(+)
MEGSTAAPYLLCGELRGHSKAVRCCCVLTDCTILSGGLDGVVIVWQKSPSGEYEEKHKWTLHGGGYVYSLCADPGGDTAVSGGQDGKALEFEVLSGRVMKAFTGHTGPVSTLILSGEFLLSGSWDATVRVWNRRTSDIIYELSGHSYAATVGVLKESDEAEEMVILTGSQDKAIRFWKGGKETLCLNEAHQDIVRSISGMGEEGFLTASNDGEIKWWSTEGILVATLLGHTSFVFDIKYSEKEVLSASDDCSVKVWDVGRCDPMQSILHEASVWQVNRLSNGDIISCSEDCLLRIWTRATERALPEENRKIQREAAEMIAAQVQKGGMDTVDASRLPDVSELNSIKGQKDGETKMFREGGSAIAFSWNGSSWDRIGEVMGSAKQGPFYEGDKVFPAGNYDYIFNVEIGDNAQQHKLPFRANQNPLVAAESFCARNEISRANADEIASFIRANSTPSTTSSLPITTTPIVNSPRPQGSSRSSSSKGSGHIQLMEAITFKHCNFDMLMKKLIEFNDLIPADDTHHLTAVDMLHLTEAIEKCKNPNWLKLEFRGCEKELIFRKMREWSADKAFPVMDLWRVLSLHPDCACLHKGSDDGWAYISVALKYLKADSIDSPLSQCSLRYFANMFALPTNRYALLRRREQILDKVADHVYSKNKHVRIALSTLLVNFIVGFGEKDDPEGRLQVVSMLSALLDCEEDEEPFYRCLAGLEALLLQEPSTAEVCRDLGVTQILQTAPAVKFAESTRIAEAAKLCLALLRP